MKSSNYLSFLTSVCLVLGLSACGSSGDGPIDSQQTSDVSLRFSDAAIEDLSNVVITVDQLIFSRDDRDDISVDTFTSDELGITNSETFEIDLLTVQGNDNKLVLDSVDLPVGDYKNLSLVVLDEDTDLTYVRVEESGLKKDLKVPSDRLKLGAFSVSSDSSQTFVVEFGLRQAISYNPGPDRYILKPRGVRIVRLEDASTIQGSINLASIHLDDACSSKLDSTIGNVAYLYEGHELDPSLLGDVFVREDEDTENTEIDPDVAANIIAPIAATDINGTTGEYLFSYLEAGDYTLAISCNADNDDSVMHDEFVIPSPANELIEINLAIGTNLQCNFPTDGSCTAL